MFTPAGGRSRATRATRRPQLSAADQPAVPIAGPPSYSYGSPNTGRPRPLNVQDTNSTIAGAFNAAISDAESRRTRRSSRLSVVSDFEDDDTSQYSSSSRRTPRTKNLSLEEVEASVNRRRSLRSGSRSIGRSSPSISSLQDVSENKKPQDTEISLEYEVTQSSLEKSYDEEEALLAQLDRPTKESQYPDETTFGNNTSAQYTEEDSAQRSLLGRLADDLHFWYFMVGRMAKQLFSMVLEALRHSGSILKKIMRPALLAASVCVLALAVTASYSGLPDQLRQMSRASSYMAPSTLPSTSEEVVSRLVDLERHLTRYSASTSDLEQRVARIGEGIHTNENRIDRTENLLEKSEGGRKQVSQQILALEEALRSLKDEQKASASTVDGLTSSMREVEAQLAAQKSELKQYIKTGLTLSDELKELQSNTKSHTKSLQELDQKLSRVASAKEIEKIALATIESALPDKLLVALKQGRPQSTAEFWKYLGTVFARKDEITNVHGGTEVSALNWSEFLRMNEKDMKAFIHEENTSRVQDDNAIVSKSYFMDMLKREIATVRENLEERLSSFSQHERESSANRGGPWSSRTRNISESAVEHLVASAIHKHSLDVLARPDYAMYSSGARINPFLTSATYMHRPTALLPRLASRLLFNIGTSWSHPPAVAIHPSNAVGMCWAFPGQAGQLSVKLSHAIVLTDVAIEHVHPDIAHDATTAPKDLEIWAHIGETFVDEFEAQQQSAESEEVVLRNAPAAGFVHVMDVTYNIYNDEQSVQSFAVPQSMRRLNVPVNQVVYRVRSNWGNEAFTCVYRVRAIGYREVAENHDAIELDEDVASDEFM